MPSDAQSIHPTLPGDLRPLFWDYDFQDLCWDDDRALIIRRVLTSGPWDSVQWLRSRVNDDTLGRWIIDHQGRGLSPQQLRFWQLILDLPTEQVDGWLADRQTDPWHHRQAS